VNKIYMGQSSLRIVLDTYADLEGCDAAFIRYRKPDDTKGSFAAAVLGGETGTIFYDCRSGDLDQAGWWAFWAYIQFEDGRAAAGEASKVYVWREGR
jgi:hypothetical protein